LVRLQKEKLVDKIMHVLDKELNEMEEEDLDRPQVHPSPNMQQHYGRGDGFNQQ
jgi:hypothetical protein